MKNALTRLATRAMPAAHAFAAGLVFGLGIIVSALADPASVLAFLDVAGAWDPSLLFTMGASVAIGLVAFGFARRRASTLLGMRLHLPTATVIDRRLVVGGVLFGIGWGLAGICPGPGLVVLGTGSLPAALFVASMVAGMASFDRAERWSVARAADRATKEPSGTGPAAAPRAPLPRASSR